MTALNFQKRFAEQVANRSKRQTLRATRRDGKPPCKLGGPLTFYCGLRSKNTRKLGQAVCTYLAPITIIPPTNGGLYPRVSIGQGGGGERVLSRTDTLALLHADGFTAAADFVAFFCPHGKPWHGWIIKWRPS